MITPRQLEIYNNLLKYTQEGEVFYKADQLWKGVTYRIFSYRLGAYTPFMQPDALEGRGIMFELDANEQPVRLACRPMHKFFNLNENPSTMSLDISPENIAVVMDKADGSLISSWVDHEGELQLKSKTSLHSDQVRMAWEYLRANGPYESEHFPGVDYSLLGVLRDYAQTGTATVNMEYIGPDNRIVIGYEDPRLRVLNTRVLEDGEYDHSMLYWTQHPLFGYSVEERDEALDIIKDGHGYEGVVVILKSGQWFKQKTDWYAALHHTKDSINSKRRLFECVICETADDLKAMFFDDALAIKQITEMEQLVIPKYNAFIQQVEAFYVANKDLDRKSYAIKGQQELSRDIFSLAMNLYLVKPNDYKAWAIKHIELFGVKDEVKVVE